MQRLSKQIPFFIEAMNLDIRRQKKEIKFNFSPFLFQTSPFGDVPSVLF
ncbi:MAG: hypothetical protein RLY14_1039 [Planctomycetota bacterium]